MGREDVGVGGRCGAENILAREKILAGKYISTRKKCDKYSCEQVRSIKKSSRFVNSAGILLTSLSPIRGEYPGHVIPLDQSEASFTWCRGKLMAGDMEGGAVVVMMVMMMVRGGGGEPHSCRLRQVDGKPEK